MRLCLVCHRAAPYPGGTESYVQAMAEAAQARGHTVMVLAGSHQGPHNGIEITDDIRCVTDMRHDLIVTHGATDGPPRQCLDQADQLPSPVLYMLVAHKLRHVRRRHLKAATLLGWSTPLDQRVIARAAAGARAVPVRHGIDIASARGTPGFRARHGIAPDRRMFLSCGGYAPHKRMRALARIFRRSEGDSLLVTTGYSARPGAMPRPSDRVMPLENLSHDEVLSAMAEADGYLMHSREEGFGLVLLEAMVNRTPWIAHATGGAEVLAAHGQVYRRGSELLAHLNRFDPDPARIAAAEAAAVARHSIEGTIDDLEAAAAHPAALARSA
jgi:glycosyltransferase involved in cell wall biosynthesis